MSRGPASDTSFAPFVKFNMAAVNRRLLLEGCFFILMGAFQRKRRRERQIIHRLWVREIFQKREFWYFAVGNAVHPAMVAVATIAGDWFPYDYCDRYDRCDRIEVYLSDRGRCDRWRVVSI